MNLNKLPRQKTFLSFILVLMATLSFAQAPQMLNYQTIVRGANGQPVANNTPVKLRFTIHDNGATGTSVFTETSFDTTNQFGLVNVQIGATTSLAVVNWGSGAKYLQVEADINNSGSFVDMGASQLISVPYALYAQNSNPGPAGPTGAVGPQGPTGASGIDGTNGINGATGPTGVGSTGPTGPAGVDGQNGINGNTGPTGPAGAQGAPGTDGATGPQGTAGAAGPQGNAGATGPQGNDGAAGPQGNQGNQGPQGNQGIQGPQGNDGAQGAQGPQGATGPAGPTGPAGTAGSWQLVDFSDFQSGTDNWTVVSGGMTRNSFTNVGPPGNYIYYMTGNSTTAITKAIDLTNYPHTYVMVKFTYWFIDSWDANSDRGQCSISSDNSTYTSIWLKYGWTSLGTANLIQQTSSSYNDYYVREDAISPHTGNTLYVKFDAVGIGNANDESFGVDDIEVYVR